MNTIGIGHVSHNLKCTSCHFAVDAILSSLNMSLCSWSVMSARVSMRSSSSRKGAPIWAAVWYISTILFFVCSSPMFQSRLRVRKFLRLLKRERITNTDARMNGPSVGGVMSAIQQASLKLVPSQK